MEEKDVWVRIQRNSIWLTVSFAEAVCLSWMGRQVGRDWWAILSGARRSGNDWKRNGESRYKTSIYRMLTSSERVTDYTATLALVQVYERYLASKVNLPLRRLCVHIIYLFRLLTHFNSLALVELERRMLRSMLTFGPNTKT